MVNLYEYGNLTIEVLNEASFAYGSADTTHKYSKQYYSSGGFEHPTSVHGIKILSEGELVNDCIIIGCGGATGIQPDSAVLNHDELVICCCDTVFCLTADQLELKWQTRADQATCFGVYKLDGSYIVHGEIQVSKLDWDGNILWSFEGADIFVSPEGEDSFQLHPDHIALVDWYGNRYDIDFDGKVISV